MKTKYKILPFNRKIIINEEILVHFFNWVIDRRRLIQDITSHISDAELQNWKVKLIEDMLRGIKFKDKDDE